MESTEFEFDDDVEQLVGLLLRKFAKEKSDFNRYGNIGDQLGFEIANRGLVALGWTCEPVAPPPEPKQ